MQLDAKRIASSVIIAIAAVAAGVAIFVFSRETDTLRFGIIAVDASVLILGVVATVAATVAFGQVKNFGTIIRRLWFVAVSFLVVATILCIVFAPNPRSPYLGP